MWRLGRWVEVSPACAGDPLIRLVMASDGVTQQEMIALMDRNSIEPWQAASVC